MRKPLWIEPTAENIEKFWSKVTKSDGCWEWSTSRNPALGVYGQFYAGHRKKVMAAHRFSWLITYGDPGDLHVCHHCDNPSCVRPDHLFLGTDHDNSMDAYRKGRLTTGKQCKTDLAAYKK